MNPSITLGHIAGIRIGINWSWLLVFGLITWTLADVVFPNQNPGLSDRAYIAMALVAALLFFGSLLLHELGHAFVARREGMVIEGVTLWLFGGVAQFRGTFPSAGAEFRIAVAGPLVSLALGLAFAFIPSAVSLPEAIDAVSVWLGYINLTLLVFNLLPALPLDGGRILRSGLWQLKGDFGWATGIAVAIGRVIGLLLVAAGLAVLVLRSTFTGLWLAFIGWFIVQAASSERRTSKVQQALGSLRVGDLMVRDPVTVAANLTVARFMTEVAPSARHATYPVLEDGHAVGLLALRRAEKVPGQDWQETTVRDCMISLQQVPVLTADDAAVDALNELDDHREGSALVLDGERLAGLLSITDLGRAVELAKLMRARDERR